MNKINSSIKTTIVLLTFFLSSNNVFAQFIANASSTLPLIEIRDEKSNQLQKAIKMDELVNIINVSEDNNYVFAHSNDFVYRVNITSEKIEKIEVPKIYQPVTENLIRSHSTSLNKGKSNKTFYHSNELHEGNQGYVSIVYFLGDNIFNSSSLFFYTKQMWSDNNKKKFTTNQTTAFYKIDFKTMNISKHYEIETINKYGAMDAVAVTSNKLNKQLLYCLDYSGQLTLLNLASKKAFNIFRIEIPEEFNLNINTRITLADHDSVFHVTITNSKIMKGLILNYDKVSFRKTKEIFREGDSIYTRVSNFKNSSIWYYVKSPFRFATLPQSIPYPSYPVYPAKRRRKLIKAYEIEVEQYHKKADSISKLNAQYLIEWKEKIAGPQSKVWLVFSDEELSNQIFNFKGISTSATYVGIELISETVLRVTYHDSTVEEYDIQTKKLLKTSKKKPTSIDDF